MIERNAENYKDYESLAELALSSSEPVRISGASGKFIVMSEETYLHDRWVAEVESALERSEQDFAAGRYYTLDEVIDELNRDIFKHEHI